MTQLTQWLNTTPYRDFTLTIASADASFRKYYRLTKGSQTFIVMDSSLELDSLPPFLDVTQRLLDVGVNAPHIYERNLEKGYLIIEDFGSLALLDTLNRANFKRHYTNAIQTIVTMQEASVENLPLYDRDFLHFEMHLMQEWYLEKKLNLTLSKSEQNMLDASLSAIADGVLSQPQGLFVHRDFHSRNIMLTPNDNIGVIDYQDAMSGALTYDLVSLLKDCYVAFDRAAIESLALTFRDKKGLDVSDAVFLKWFDFMGLQRHIKVLGVFSRLDIRDGKDGYLKDIPLTLSYTIDAASRYKETAPLAAYLTRVTQ